MLRELNLAGESVVYHAILVDEYSLSILQNLYASELLPVPKQLLYSRAVSDSNRSDGALAFYET